MRAVGAVASLVFIVALLGCAAEPSTGPSGTPSSPAAAPTATRADSPAPALELSCGDSVDSASLGAILGGTASLLDNTIGSTAGGYAALWVALQQVGAVSCEWWMARPDGGNNIFDFRVVVDAAADFRVATDPSATMPGVVRDTLGDESALWCSHAACRFDVLVGDSWIAGSVSVVGEPAVNLDEVTVLLEDLVSNVAVAPRADDVWERPAGAADGWGWDCQYPGPEAPVLAALRVAFNRPDMNSTGVQIDDRFEPRRVIDALSFCPAVAGEYEVNASASFVAGGAWVVDHLPAELGDGYLAVDVPGASQAFVTCAEFCRGLLAIDGSLLIVEAAPEAAEVFGSRLAPVVAAVQP